MARLPIPGSDVSDWGVILNEFLRIAHNEDGSMKLAEVVAQKYTLPTGGVPRAHLSTDVQASLTAADDLVQAVSDMETSNRQARDAAEPLIQPGSVTQYYRGDKTWQPLDKYAVGLGNVENVSALPLTGGTLTGNVTIASGNVLRAYHTDNVKYIEIKTDQYWSRINASGTSGFVLTGSTVQMDASNAIVTHTQTVRPNSNLSANIGSVTHYYNNFYALRHYFNSGAYIDGTTTGIMALSDGAKLALGTGTGTVIGTAPSQKLSFFNTTPVVQPTGGNLTAAAAYSANEQLMLNRIWTALRSLGLISS